MLADKEMFVKMGNTLCEHGILKKFEEENGEITGHMMIGIAFDLDTMELIPQMWFTPQTDDAVEPSSEWIEFFVKTLCENISEDGFGVPMYSFLNDHSDLTIVPTKS